MQSLDIRFRLTTFQLARGLYAIRQLESTYKPSSLNQLAKICFIDYCAKMSLGRSDMPPQEIMNEILLMAKPIDQQPKTLPTQTDLAVLSNLTNLSTDQLPRAKPTTKQKPEWRIQRELEEEKLFNQMRKESLEKMAMQETTNTSLS